MLLNSANISAMGAKEFLDKIAADKKELERLEELAAKAMARRATIQALNYLQWEAEGKPVPTEIAEDMAKGDAFIAKGLAHMQALKDTHALFSLISGLGTPEPAVSASASASASNKVNTVQLKPCTSCRELAKLSLCGGCRQVGYCSKACQIIDRKEHKNVCNKNLAHPTSNLNDPKK